MVLSLSAIEYSLQYEKIIVLNLGCILDTEGENYTDETPEILSILVVRQPLGSTLFWGLKFFFSVDFVSQYTQFAKYFGWLAISLGQFEIISIKQNGRQKY